MPGEVFNRWLSKIKIPPHSGGASIMSNVEGFQAVFIAFWILDNCRTKINRGNLIAVQL
jgi:hypothetical protein